MIILISLVFLGYVTLTLLNYMQMTGTGEPSSEEINEKVKAVLQENLVDYEHLQFEFCVSTHNGTDIHGDETSLTECPPP